MTLPILSMLAEAENPLNHVVPHAIYTFRDAAGHPLTFLGFPLQITNHMLMVAVSAFLVFLVFTWVGIGTKKNPVPSGGRNFFEAIASFLRTEVFRPALGDNADRFAPFLWTVFFFILFCNLLGMIPMGEIMKLATNGGPMGHMWGTATGGITITASLAVVAFLTIHLSGVIQQVRIQMDPSLDPHHTGHDHTDPHGHGQWHGMEGVGDEADVKLNHHVGDGHDHAHGVHHSRQFQGKPFALAVPLGIGKYIWNFAPHPDVGMKAMNLGLFAFLLILEAFGSLVKPFSLSVRLFANMLAGHLLLGVLIGLIGAGAAMMYGVGPIVVLGCAALSLLELLVAFLQAYIFTFLTTLFIASAVAPEH